MHMNNASRLLSALGFVVLSTFCGIGFTWMIIGFFAGAMNSFVAKSMPILALGGVLGFATGLVVALRVARAGPQAQARLEKKYIRPSDRVRIYLGAPMFIGAVISIPLLERNLNMYVWLGIFLAIIALSLFIHDRLPQRSIIPIGIIGWLLTIMFGLAYGFGFLGGFKF